MAHVFHDLLASGQTVRVFSLSRIVHPVIFDVFGFSRGFHGLWLDQEHGGMTAEQIQLASACARANGLGLFVRMAPAGYALVTQNLEAGAHGVMAARLESADGAEGFVRWCKFAPRGDRGVNSSGFDARYTYKPLLELVVDANRDHFVAIQIETLGALDQVDRIAAIDGVDLLFVGPADMSQALGCVGQVNHQKVWDAIDKVAAACREHGKPWGTVPAGPDYAARCLEKGCRMLTLANETLAVRRGVDALKEWYSAYF
ncbi:MAG: HpcH/HpaI aldolase family protein [Planctomycetota bacterium]|jgi:2-dehydro-3-deoxyglucarate aldolase/4-hydroxy-2-oxoheptanedioate aldolase